jgi:hypothetical protein
MSDQTSERTCKVCGATIHKVIEPHWIGWEDEGDDQLSYVPTLHDHTPR